MRALYFDEKLEYRTDHEKPLAKKGEALIRVLASGICSTDLEIMKGYMGFKGIPGHEFAGIVEECIDKSFQGKRVAGEINISCAKCDYCRAGMKNHCPQRSVLGILGKNGAFADYITLPIENLHILPENISDEEAVFIEPLAAAFRILEQAAITRKDRVCVLGDGRLGSLIAQVMLLTGCSLVMAGRHEEKLAFLKGRGVSVTTDIASLKREFDIMVECAGSAEGVNIAAGLVKPGGKIFLKTTVAANRNFDFNRLVIDEVSVIGSRCGPFRPAIDALANGSVDVKPFISRVFPFEKGIEAFDYAASKGVMKVIITA